MPDITKLLDVSTSAITSETDVWLTNVLNQELDHELTLYKHDVGYFIHVRAAEDDSKFADWRPGMPYELVKLLEWAQTQGCGWVLLHGDGGPVPEGLPSFEW